ncbi:MAG: hypothetical protein AMJ94_03565 [Deltaproteobacteria bacterium SM23_61]|nr:MAG: hypothetical protein AMJ94_03565 [Deltaproteobacteria bacterium SM23_61]
MADYRKFHDYAAEIEKRLRLQTYVLAVKRLKDEKEIPKGAERPMKDYGYHMPLCQGFALSRKEDKTIAMIKEDMWCFEPIVGYGWEPPPQYFMDGNNRYPQDVKDLEAGKNYASDFPKMETGKYKGVVSASLSGVNFTPDMILIYCNSPQLSLLLLGREYMDGHDLPCHLSSHAACVYSVVPVINSGQYQVAVPCRGDRYFALAGDEELIFTVPTPRIEDLLTGLRHLEKYGSRLPRNPSMMREPQFPESYRKLLKMLT